MNLTKSFVSAFDLMEKRGWDRIYVFVDIHSTVLESNWSDTELPNKYYPLCLEVLAELTRDPRIRLVMWTSSWPKDCEAYREDMAKHKVHFDFVNINTEVESKGYGCYKDKTYMNVIIDDKAGFEPEVDWAVLRDFFLPYAP